MKLEIFIDDDFEQLLDEVPGLRGEIRRAVTTMLTRFQMEQRDKQLFQSGNTLNAALQSDVPSVPVRPQMDELQRVVAAGTRNDKALYRVPEVERLLRDTH